MNDDWKGTLECQNHIHQPPLYAYHAASEEWREDFPRHFSSFIFCSFLCDVRFKPYSSSSRVNFLRMREFVFFILRSVAEADIHLQIIRPLSVCFVMFIPYSKQQRPLTTCSSCWHISQKIAIVFRLFPKKNRTPSEEEKRQKKNKLEEDNVLFSVYISFHSRGFSFHCVCSSSSSSSYLSTKINKSSRV